MKNHQRLIFLVLSTIIIIVVFTKFSTTKAEIKKDETIACTKEPKVKITEEVQLERQAEEQKRYVEDVSETKQEIVTEVKIEQATAAPVSIEVAGGPYVYASEEEIIMLAKLVYAEAGGIPSDTEQSCVIWTVLNRVDASCYPNTIAACITQPSQFAYRSSTKVTDHCLWLARDVVSRWERERAGETNVGRTLPQGYFSFWGDGRHNYFRVGYGDQNYWDYSYGTPYSS